MQDVRRFGISKHIRRPRHWAPDSQRAGINRDFAKFGLLRKT